MGTTVPQPCVLSRITSWLIVDFPSPAKTFHKIAGPSGSRIASYILLFCRSLSPGSRFPKIRSKADVLSKSSESVRTAIMQIVVIVFDMLVYGQKSVKFFKIEILFCKGLKNA